MIDRSTRTGEQINVNRLYAGLEDIKNTIMRTSDEPLKAEAAYIGMMKQLDAALQKGTTRTPTEVQRMKQRIYKELASYYESVKASPAKIELRKAVGKNAREVLEEIIPEIKQLNRNDGDLIELWDALESKANRITNNQLIGIGIPINMGAGSSIGYMMAGEKGGAIGGAIGLAIGLYEKPLVKSRLALVLAKLREKGVSINPTLAAMNLGLYESINLENMQGEEQ
jgi:hypothetical protein